MKTTHMTAAVAAPGFVFPSQAVATPFIEFVPKNLPMQAHTN
jgi:hypothetical protein